MMRKKRKNRKIGILLAAGVIFFLMSLALFFIKDSLPKPQIKSNSLVSPDLANSRMSAFRKELNKSKIDFKSVSLATTSSTLIVELDKNSYAYVDLFKDPQIQIKTLFDIVTRLGIENPEKKIKYVDLRFEKAVVKYK